MRRWAILLVLVVACSPLKAGLNFPAKCDHSPGLAWRYHHTYRWTTLHPIYDSDGDLTGFRTDHHKRDVYACQERR